MKKLLTPSLIVIASLTVANVANALEVKKSYVLTDDSLETQLCHVAATQSTQRLNSKVNAAFPSRMLSKKYAFVANNFTCNGMSIAEFALQQGNYDVAKKLNSHINNNVTILDLAKTEEQDLQNSEV